MSARRSCKQHPHVQLIQPPPYCPACRGSQGGKATSEAKAQAARENAKKPRPRPKLT